ncbi:hypothetical protein ILP92_15425 [Maribius pontilimi]|uniref:Uncharacterized protein n=1 Tax=Palleronia pontilimi TaxID=1964209 RepID=A0A934IJL4_9RHOB|nr:hypothetical protein [Palleronia pontilimi]MBJ3764141.1 hypothetical protein [Palleronia pontilimi]
MTNLIMPAKRDFGWELKPVTSSHFDIIQKDYGQGGLFHPHARSHAIPPPWLEIPSR